MAVLGGLKRAFVPSRAPRRIRSYSHGPTVGEVYAGFRKIDEVLARVRPDRTTSPEQIDQMLARGDITPTMASHFKKDAAMMTEATRTAEYWRRILWYVGVPLTALIAINTYFLEKAHEQHLEEHPHEPADYPHLRIRNKKFFWGDGDHTPFHNPQVNGP